MSLLPALSGVRSALKLSGRSRLLMHRRTAHFPQVNCFEWGLAPASSAFIPLPASSRIAPSTCCVIEKRCYRGYS